MSKCPSWSVLSPLVFISTSFLKKKNQNYIRTCFNEANLQCAAQFLLWKQLFLCLLFHRGNQLQLFWLILLNHVFWKCALLLFLDSPLLSTIYQFSTMEDEDLAVFAHCHLTCTCTPHLFALAIATLRTVLGSRVSVDTVSNSTHYS